MATDTLTRPAHGRVAVVGSLTCAPRLPHPGETFAGSTFAQVAGGKGGNQAVAAARFGAQVAMSGRIDADANGDTFIGALAARLAAGVAAADAAPCGIDLRDARGRPTLHSVPSRSAGITPGSRLTAHAAQQS